MALEAYRKKRNFKKTPEPTGSGTRTRARALFFCVQKHLARHLHYDLRLEHHGVLLSWAVPKGPSLDPRTRRLAMRVEDHPIEYGDFEGVISEGYGAGIVMLWDRGTWTPHVDDIDEALRNGDLAFTLDGCKLKGSWVLVRTRGYGRAVGASDGRTAAPQADNTRSWLLIKHRDEWAGDLDITAFAPRSVKSNDDLEDILTKGTPAASPRSGCGGASTGMPATIIEHAAKLNGTQPGATRARKRTGAPKSRAKRR